jgi:hypothetical protein
MAYTLKDILRQCYQDLGMLTAGTATGGSTASLVDSTLGGKVADWQYGTAFVDRDAAGAGGAPEGEYAAIASYTPATGTLAGAASCFTVAPAAGDFYALATPEIRLQIMRSWINRGLKFLGRIPVPDESLTTAAGTYIYATPAAAKGRVKRIFIATDADDESWTEILDWSPVIQATGTAEQIEFHSEPDAARTLRLLYEGDHPDLWVATDKLNEYVPLELAVASTCFAMSRARFRNMPNLDNKVTTSVKDMADDFLRLRAELRSNMPELAKPIGLLMGDTAISSGSRSKYGPWMP